MKKGDLKLMGFTIIEVVLVLAIAGLIMMVVFITVPSVQRGQRDATRKEDISTLLAAVKKYQTNNRGALPESTGSFTYRAADANNKTTWGGFYYYYLGDKFVDPNGTAYTLRVENCSGNLGVTCKEKSTGAMDYTMYIEIGASCDGPKAIRTENPRKIAVVYKLEGGEAYCGNS